MKLCRQLTSGRVLSRGAVAWSGCGVGEAIKACAMPMQNAKIENRQIAATISMDSRLTDKIAKALLNPPRDNDLEQRRKALKLSRVALARILGVDPATVFRQERGIMTPLWDYALRGIEAEAKRVVKILRDHQRQIEQTDTTVAWTEGQGYRYAAEAMKAQKPRRRTTTTPRVRKSIPPLTAINQKIIAAAKRAKPT
jgi:DNA-binding XRE family transcriptional regulator